MQAAEGFLKAGGFSGIYNGLASAAVGSVPGASLFFASYESAKSVLPDNLGAAKSMIAASFGETIACLIRVPTENVKQKIQSKHVMSKLFCCSPFHIMCLQILDRTY